MLTDLKEKVTPLHGSEAKALRSQSIGFMAELNNTKDLTYEESCCNE